MPTLRRSKSLNDKITRQKNRTVTGDVIRDPRAPDVEGRTRTCVDNFQALVHLRKQTEDKARQLELAYNYATSGNTYNVLRTPVGGVELPYTPRSRAATTTTPVTLASRPTPDVESRIPASASQRRQRSAEGRRPQQAGTFSSVKKQESFSEGQPPPARSQLRSRQESFSEGQPPAARSQLRSRNSAAVQGEKSQRPVSMIEPRVAVGGGGCLLQQQEELSRKDRVIQKLMDSQRALTSHNQQLLAKLDELEFQNNRLRDVIAAQRQTPDTPHPHTQPARCLSPRSLALQSDVIRTIPMMDGTSPKDSGSAISPNSETSVSGYGSLAESGCGDTFPARLVAAARTVGVGDYEDDCPPLMPGSLEHVGGDAGTVQSSASSGESPRPTLLRDAGPGDMVSIHEKLDRVLDLEKRRGGGEDDSWRLQQLEKDGAELKAERDTVLTRFKRLVMDHEHVLTRDERLHQELGRLLEFHGKGLNPPLQAELHKVQEELWDLGQEVFRQVDAVLTCVTSQEKTCPDDPQLKPVLDLIGSDSSRLARSLSLAQTDVDSIDKAADSSLTKTTMVLHTWLRQKWKAAQSSRQEGQLGDGHEPLQPDSHPSPVQTLNLALRAMDKDIRFCNHSSISAPERQSLRNSLEFAIDHVTDARDLLDHLISSNELTPSAIAFVQEVIEQPARAVSRLWHVSEYRETGFVSKLALALQKCHYPHVSARLTDELAMQNSRLHSQSHPHLTDQPDPPPSLPRHPPPPPIPHVSTPSIPPAASQVPRPASAHIRPRPIMGSRVPRPRSRTAENIAQTSRPPALAEKVENCVKPPGKGEKASAKVPPPGSGKERAAVWDKRPGAASSSSPRGGGPGGRNSVVLEQGSKISRV